VHGKRDNKEWSGRAVVSGGKAVRLDGFDTFVEHQTGLQFHRSHSVVKYSLIDEFLALDEDQIATVH
jgi:hypothetical protein